MQVTPVAHRHVAAYLARVAPAQADALMAPLAVLGQQGAGGVPYLDLPKERREAVRAGLAAAAGAFAAGEQAWVKASSRAEFDEMRHDLTVLEQAVAMYDVEEQGGGYDARDRAMADNVDWILAHEPRGTRIVLWAHNAHVARRDDSTVNMGSHLAGRHGKNYVVFGFVFARGEFQAIDWTQGQGVPGGLKAHTLGAPPESDVSVPFARTGRPILVADLRRAPKGVVADWLAAPHPMRELGAVFASEAAITGTVTLAERFDAVIFVDTTTRARPLPEGQRPPK
jgi:erythromycin esterase